jgi:hypothetical protein
MRSRIGEELTSSRGGPAEMLKVSKPRQLAEGVTMSPARLMLEILAIYETFGMSNKRSSSSGRRTGLTFRMPHYWTRTKFDFR